MEEKNSDSNEVLLVKGSEVKKAFKKRAHQSLRLGLIWFFAGVLVTAISWILAPAGGSFTLMWGLSLYGLFVIFKSFDLSHGAEKKSEEGITQEELDSLKVSKIQKILSKVFVVIGLVGLILSGFFILIYFLDSPEINEDYGRVVQDNTSTTGWLTYVADNEGIQIDFTSKPITYSFENYYSGDITTDVKFFNDDREGLYQFNLLVESNHDVYTSEKVIIDLRSHLSRYEDELIVSDISILSESENEIIYEYPIPEEAMVLREKLIYTKDNVYGLSYAFKEGNFSEDKWDHFTNSFILLNNV